MSKFFRGLLSILLVSVFLITTGCSKDEPNTTNNNQCPTPVYPVTGLWEGTYSVTGNSQPPLYYSMTIYPDGTILTKGELTTAGEISYSEGTWTLAGNVFTATINTFESPSITQQIVATFSNTGTFTNATWEVTASPYPFNAGTFSNMNRIN